jgi:hypothetical protein
VKFPHKVIQVTLCLGRGSCAAHWWIAVQGQVADLVTNEAGIKNESGTGGFGLVRTDGCAEDWLGFLSVVGCYCSDWVLNYDCLRKKKMQSSAATMEHHGGPSEANRDQLKSRSHDEGSCVWKEAHVEIWRDL